ncbi:MAG: hypothetical protein AAFP84_15490, partial [Actinomycetota bacterium]
MSPGQDHDAAPPDSGDSAGAAGAADAAGLPVEEARQLAESFVRLSRLAAEALGGRSDPVVERLREHLDLDRGLPNSSTTAQTIERANLQLALDAIEERASTWELFGVPPELGRYGEASLVGIAS